MKEGVIRDRKELEIKKKWKDREKNKKNEGWVWWCKKEEGKR